MNWEALGTIVEIVGAIAVIASLVYLAIQVRENTKLAAEQAVSSAIDAFTDHSRLIASTPDLASLLLRGETALNSLSPEELRRFDQLASIEFSIYESRYEKSIRSRGVPEHDDLMKAMLVDRLSNPGSQELWQSNRKNYTPSFVEWVDSIKES